MQTRREAAIEAAQHPDAPPFRDRRPAGRPIRDPRARLDAIFWLAAHTLPGRAPPPWAALPERFGKPDTVSRQFRRWAKQGLWTKLLEALADPHRPGITILRRLESWICRAYRRAWRLLGVQRHGARPAPRLPFRPARPLLAAARPRFVRTGLFQAPRRHAPRPRARLARPPERLPALLQAACWPSPPADAPSRAAWRRHERLPARPSPPSQRRPRQRRAPPASQRSAVRATAARSVAPNGGGAFVRSGRPPAPASSPERPATTPASALRPSRGPLSSAAGTEEKARMNSVSVPASRIGDSRLAARLGRETEGEVLFGAGDRGRYATDASIYQIEPVGVLVPRRHGRRRGGDGDLPRGGRARPAARRRHQPVRADREPRPGHRLHQAPAARAVRGRGGTAWRGWSRASPSAR